jgi:hypothetical protein
MPMDTDLGLSVASSPVAPVPTPLSVTSPQATATPLDPDLQLICDWMNFSPTECLTRTSSNPLRSRAFSTIPTQIERLTSLTHLDLMGALLTGTIPSSLGNLSRLTYLGLAYTDLTGTIPSSLGKLLSLTVLYLSLIPYQDPFHPRWEICQA